MQVFGGFPGREKQEGCVQSGTGLKWECVCAFAETLQHVRGS